MAITTIPAGSAAISQTLNDNFQDLDTRLNLVNSTISAQGSTINTINGNIQSLQTPSIITLTGTTPTLTDNSIHQITISDTTTFSFPVISDTTKFHQMLVLINMPTAKTINLGTDTFFGGYAPDLSEAGTYTLIYEYDGTEWVVGALYKAEETEPEEETEEET